MALFQTPTRMRTAHLLKMVASIILWTRKYWIRILVIFRPPRYMVQ